MHPTASLSNSVCKVSGHAAVNNDNDPQHIQIIISTVNNGPLTSRKERLAKAEAPSEASLLLASRKERLPGGRRCRGGREESPRPPQSTSRPSEEQRQGGGQDQAGGGSAARRQRTQRKTDGGDGVGKGRREKT